MVVNEVDLSSREKTPLSLVGAFVQVHWVAECHLAERQCERCVYVVRGLEGGLVCVELIYDAIDGVHRHDAIHWVPVQAISFMRVLTEKEAELRIQRLEKTVFGPDHPRD